MGKIFDALEKANRKNASAVLLSVTPEKRRQRRSKPQHRDRTKPVKPANNKQENVVSLMDANRNKAGLLDQTLITYHAPQSVEAELFKVLRTNILFPAKGTPPKSILVTSALPGDGKSFVSSNLAISIAQGIEEYVLLVDGDLRKPAIHDRFGFGNVSGLSEYLKHGDDIGGAFLKSSIEKLTLLPAGEPPANPSELMSSKKMKALMEELTTRYSDRYVIIDSPPPNMAAETNAIAKYADGIILVVRAQKTPREAVAETIEKIGKEKLIGIVLNQADQSATKYYGYTKSYYRQK